MIQTLGFIGFMGIILVRDHVCVVTDGRRLTANGAVEFAKNCW